MTYTPEVFTRITALTGNIFSTLFQHCVTCAFYCSNACAKDIRKLTTILGKTFLPCQAWRAAIMSLPLMTVVAYWMSLLYFGLKFFIVANYILKTYFSKNEKVSVNGVSRQVSLNLLFQKWLKSTWTLFFSLSLCMHACVLPHGHLHGKIETYGILHCYNTEIPHTTEHYYLLKLLNEVLGTWCGLMIIKVVARWNYLLYGHEWFEHIYIFKLIVISNVCIYNFITFFHSYKHLSVKFEKYTKKENCFINHQILSFQLKITKEKLRRAKLVHSFVSPIMLWISVHSLFFVIHSVTSWRQSSNLGLEWWQHLFWLCGSIHVTPLLKKTTYHPLTAFTLLCLSIDMPLTLWFLYYRLA